MRTNGFGLLIVVATAFAFIGEGATQEKKKEGPPPGGLLPPFVREKLMLSEQQQQKLGTLGSSVQIRLGKILTPQQIQQLDDIMKQGPGAKGQMPKGPKGPPGLVIPPFAEGRLQLTAAQQRQVAALERYARVEVFKILTPAQRRQFEGAFRQGPGNGPGKQGQRQPEGVPPPAPASDASAAGIQWYASLKMGLQEAERTGRPILLVAGTPHCAGVSGTWCPGKEIMDRDFLCQDAVIEASRNFICMRLLTYEDAAEAKFLKSLFLGGSGDLENSLFAILAPDGKKALVKAHRSPRHDFEDAAQLANNMNRVARSFGEPKPATDLPLPLIGNVRLALNTAACDRRPLVAIVAEDAQVRQRLENVMASLAWSAPHLGRFMYVSTAALKEKSMLKGIKDGSVILVIQPDRFGLGGTVLAQTDANAAREKLAEVLATGLSLHKPGEQAHRDHVREGHRQGIFWETAIPVTDPWERRAREEGRSRKDREP